MLKNRHFNWKQLILLQKLEVEARFHDTVFERAYARIDTLISFRWCQQCSIQVFCVTKLN